MRGQWLVAGVLVLAPLAGQAQQGSRANAGADTESAQQQDAATAKVLRADQRPETAAVQKLTVTTSSFAPDGPIPNKYSSYGDSISPSVTWSNVPAAKSFAVIMEDPEGHAAEPVAHWVIWNVPPTTRSLPEGLPKQDRLTQPAGAVQGKTTSGALGYYGPHPPAGDAPHHYHIQVFALDTTLDLPPGSTRDQVVTAMKGHVLAKGEVVGTFGKP